MGPEDLQRVLRREGRRVKLRPERVEAERDEPRLHRAAELRGLHEVRGPREDRAADPAAELEDLAASRRGAASPFTPPS